MVQRAMEGGRTTEWVFRHCHPDHANLTETLVASRDHDDRGRFHIRGSFGAVYVACDSATALAELDHKAAHAGLTRSDLLPRYMLTLGDRDRAFELLEQAYERRDVLMMYLKMDRVVFASLRPDPRFAVLLAKIRRAD